MTDQPKMWHHDMRCPVCLTLGKLRYQFGYYVCDPCDRTFEADTLGHFNMAFEVGRRFIHTHAMKYKLTESLPPHDWIVRCHRKWNDPDGVVRTETAIAKRGNAELGRAGWQGLNAHSGHWWKDDTVESWEPL